MNFPRPSSRAAGAFSSLLSLALGALLLLGGTGCGDAPDDGVATIRFARWGLPEEIAAERELVGEFEKLHPDIHVVVEFYSWSEYWNKLQAQMAAEAAPDVFLIGGTYIHDYVARDQLEDLNSYIEATPDFHLADYFSATVGSFQFADGLWALPRDCNTIGIYYNKALFDEHGVEYPAEGWTWDDFHSKAKALTVDKDGDGRMESYGYLAGIESMECQWVSWIWQNGGEVLDEERRHCLLDQPAAVEAMEFFAGLVLRDKVSPDTAQASTFGSNMFLTGRLAMSSEGSWMIRLFSQIEGFEWGVAPLPQGKRAVAPVNGLGNAIYAKSKHKDAAWRLVRFLSSKTYQEKLAQSGTSIPALKSVAYSPVYLDPPPANKEAFLRQIEAGRTLDFTQNFSRWEDAIRQQLELVWLGKKDVATAMNDATVAVDAILQKIEER